MGYRLTGDPPLNSLCCVHLRAAVRTIVTFTPGTAWVLLSDQDQQAPPQRTCMVTLRQYFKISGSSRLRVIGAS